MDVVVINRSHRKMGLMLALLGLLLLSPLLMYFLDPDGFSGFLIEAFSSPISFGVIAFGTMLIASVCIALVLLRILLSNTSALELSEKGIRYNPTGRSEQFLPADDIYGASLQRSGDGTFSTLLVLRKEGREEHLNAPLSEKILKTAPAMRIWHEFLDGSPEAIAQAINQYFNISKTVEKPEIVEVNKTSNAYVPVIVGLALISLGVVIPFASVPLWIGLSAALLLLALGSIILFTKPDKLNSRDLPKHIAQVTRRCFNTLFSGFVAPEPTVSKRIIGAVLYPAVGIPAIYAVLSHVMCSKLSCVVAREVSTAYFFPLLVALIIVGYGMGVGRKA